MTKSNTFDWLCVQIPLFSEGFRLPYLMTLRKIAPDVSHHLQVFYSACCYPLIIKYLSHFPRLSIWRYILGQYPSRLILSVNSVACYAFKKITYTTCMSPYYSVILFAKATFVSKLNLIQICTVRSGHPWSAPCLVKK